MKSVSKCSTVSRVSSCFRIVINVCTCIVNIKCVAIKKKVLCDLGCPRQEKSDDLRELHESETEMAGLGVETKL